MAEEAIERLRAAVDVVVERRTIGPTSEVRIKRAIAELIRAGDKGQVAALDEASRAVHAAKDGRLDQAVAEELMRLLTTAWMSAGNSPAPKRATTIRTTKAARQHHGRELRRVPPGTTVVYDGVEATIRGGRIYLPDGQHFDTPTPAARHVTGQPSVNGWDVWRLRDGRPLSEAYDMKTWPKDDP